MSYGKIDNVKFGLGFLLLAIVAFVASCSKPAANLPKDILGIGVGMSKENVEPRLREIAEFERDERKRQQIWRLKNDARFSRLAIGYDEEYQVRYITAFVDKETAKERIRFTDIGDVGAAVKEITAPHHRYIWEVGANAEKPGYLVNAYGNEPEFLTMLTLARPALGKSEEKEE